MSQLLVRQDYLRYQNNEIDIYSEVYAVQFLPASPLARPLYVLINSL